jgi:hypothetical protein
VIEIESDAGLGIGRSGRMSCGMGIGGGLVGQLCCGALGVGTCAFAFAFAIVGLMLALIGSICGAVGDLL